MKIRKISILLAFSVLLISPLLLGPFSASASTNQTLAAAGDNLGNTTGKGLVPNCDPKLPPSAVKGQTNPDGGVYSSDGCGINKLVELIKNIMYYLYIIAIPIAVLAIGWGGFQIMTAAGSAEKVSAGRGTMQLAITGIVIMLLSYFVIQFIFIAMGVSTSFAPGGLIK